MRHCFDSGRLRFAEIFVFGLEQGRALLGRFEIGLQRRQRLLGIGNLRAASFLGGREFLFTLLSQGRAIGLERKNFRFEFARLANAR